MILATTEAVAGICTVKVLGLVRGSTVRARHLGRDFLAGLRTLVGGEVIEYTRLLAEAREEAVRRMEESAEELGADAIVSMRLMTSMVIGGAAEILAYGTAVLVEES